MKYRTYMIAALVTVSAASCNREKGAIDDAAEANKEAIDTRKDEVDAEARRATEQAELNAKLDAARIEADRVSAKAQLDADKKIVDAEAEAAKARVDAGNE